MYTLENEHGYIFVLNAKDEVVNFYADCGMIDKHYLSTNKMIRILAQTITNREELLATYFNMSKYYGYDRFMKFISENVK